MQVFVPYTKLSDATLISLIGYDYKKVRLSGKYGYSNYLKQRWEEKKSFINVEHDVVPWVGAVQSLIDCPRIWCGFDYSFSNWELDPINSIPLGCVKISVWMIGKLEGIWDGPIDWRECDVALFKEAKKRGIQPHQHLPSIVNANAVLLK